MEILCGKLLVLCFDGKRNAIDDPFRRKELARFYPEGTDFSQSYNMRLFAYVMQCLMAIEQWVTNLIHLGPMGDELDPSWPNGKLAILDQWITKLLNFVVMNDALDPSWTFW